MFRNGLVFVLLLASANCAREGFGPGLQDWGFTTVREGAHMFWWLYYTTANVTSHYDRPLVIWLQGGPGASSTGYGNFEELGPLDLELNERQHTWVKDMNVIFIDNPVGSGFSYVDNASYLTTDNAQIGADLVELIRQFYEHLPGFKSVPLHIFSESYGGKMAAEFAYLLNKEIRDGTIDCDLQSVSLIDSWMSPIDSVLSWAPFLLSMGIVDVEGHDDIVEYALMTEQAVIQEQWVDATNLWGLTEYVIVNVTHGVDFYNILYPTSFEETARKMKLLRENTLGGMYRTLVAFDERDDILEALMNGAVREALDIPDHVVWGSQSGITFNTLAGDFMKPVTDVVELLLNTTSIHVVCITGHLDLIVATPGTVKWVDELKWPGKQGYVNSFRNGLGVNGVLEGYTKIYDKFSMYWVNRAGHMVPADNPVAMASILRDVTNYG